MCELLQPRRRTRPRQTMDRRRNAGVRRGCSGRTATRQIGASAESGARPGSSRRLSAAVLCALHRRWWSPARVPSGSVLAEAEEQSGEYREGADQPDAGNGSATADDNGDQGRDRDKPVEQAGPLNTQTLDRGAADGRFVGWVLWRRAPCLRSCPVLSARIGGPTKGGMRPESVVGYDLQAASTSERWALATSKPPGRVPLGVVSLLADQRPGRDARCSFRRFLRASTQPSEQTY
jgi:hypothetical protein